MKKILLLVVVIGLSITATYADDTTLQKIAEKHLQNMIQLTFGGDNAEAYFSPNGKKICFQSNNKAWGLECDQIFYADIDKLRKDSNNKPKMVSTGFGRTTCSYYMPNNKHILYASTHESDKACPPVPISNGKY